MSCADTALDGLGEAIEEAIEDGIVALEEGLDAFGEGISALDDRVERARASVETALNELVRGCLALEKRLVVLKLRWRESDRK